MTIVQPVAAGMGGQHHTSRRLAVVGLLFPALGAGAQDTTTSLTPAQRQSSLAAIQNWRGFEGTWEGEVRYVAASRKRDWHKHGMSFRVAIANNEPKAYFRAGGRDWTELGTTYRVNQPDPLTLVVHVYVAGGEWTENNVIILTRRSENAADVFVQRVVNNWAGKPPPGEDAVFGDTRSGKLERR